MSKFKTGLVKEVREKEEYEKNQERLKKIHKLDTSAVIVEKSNTIKFLISNFKTAIRVVFTIIIVLLVGVGISVFLIKEVRTEWIYYINSLRDYFISGTGTIYYWFR